MDANQLRITELTQLCRQMVSTLEILKRDFSISNAGKSLVEKQLDTAKLTLNEK